MEELEFVILRNDKTVRNRGCAPGELTCQANETNRNQ